MTEILKGMIPFGRENAISRRQLALSLGIPDRTMREAIEKARADGLMIVNLGDGNGYYQTDDLDEIYAQLKIEGARMRALKRRIRPMQKKLRIAGYKV